MLRTESFLLLVLGFSLASLIALLIGRLLWPIAVRRGARRMQRQVPTTLAELQSERDRLRAEYAMLSQKLSARLDAVKMQTAEQMSEAIRNRNRIDSFVEEVATRDAALAARDEEIARLRSRMADLEQESASAQTLITSLRNELASRDSAQTLPEILPAPEIDERLKHRIEDLTALSQEIAKNRDETPAVDALPQEDLEKSARETEDLQQELARLDAAWGAKLSEAGEERDAQPTVPATPEPTRAVAKVISLANRIKSLKTDLAK
jgi:uncharacterized phage infection (PIP) family protein YhgE